jgi:indole-3-glycerol phosphate synthase
MPTNSADLLATIVAATRRVVAVRRSRAPFDEVAARAEVRARTPCRGFRRALGRTDRVNVIAECKRRSPSAALRHDYVPAAIAAVHERPARRFRY